MILDKTTVKKYLKGCAEVNKHIIVVCDKPDTVEAKVALEKLSMYDKLAENYTSHGTVRAYLMDAWELPPVRIGDTEIEVEKGFVYLTSADSDVLERYVCMAEFRDRRTELFNKYEEEYENHFKEIFFC